MAARACDKVSQDLGLGSGLQLTPYWKREEGGERPKLYHLIVSGLTLKLHFSSLHEPRNLGPRDGVRGEGWGLWWACGETVWGSATASCCGWPRRIFYTNTCTQFSIHALTAYLCAPASVLYTFPLPPNPNPKKGPSLNFAQLDGPESGLLHRIHCPQLNFKGSPVLHHQNASRHESSIERCLFGIGHASALCCAFGRRRRRPDTMPSPRCSCVLRGSTKRGTMRHMREEMTLLHRSCHELTKKHATNRRSGAKTQRKETKK